VRPIPAPIAHVLLGCLAALLLLHWTPAAGAETAATLSASFMPEHLGERTTLYFGFSFSAPPGQVPPPLVQIELRYPNYLGFALSGLGLATCTVQILEARGPQGCPPDSVMGIGTASTGIVLGTTTVSEEAPITIYRAPDSEGRLAVLFYSEGTTPVDTRIVFPGLLLPASAPFGGRLSIGVPLVPTLPGAPYISVLHLKATIGPHGIVYYEKVGGRMLAYEPRGILLPKGCPKGGFPFAAQFGFLDATTSTAQTAVPCPARSSRRRRAKGRRG
jgi:hypothetical protein